MSSTAPNAPPPKAHPYTPPPPPPHGTIPQDPGTAPSHNETMLRLRGHTKQRERRACHTRSFALGLACASAIERTDGGHTGDACGDTRPGPSPAHSPTYPPSTAGTGWWVGRRLKYRAGRVFTSGGRGSIEKRAQFTGTINQSL